MAGSCVPVVAAAGWWSCFNRPQFPNQRAGNHHLCKASVAEGHSDYQAQDDGWPEQHVDAQANKQARNETTCVVIGVVWRGGWRAVGPPIADSAAGAPCERGRAWCGCGCGHAAGCRAAGAEVKWGRQLGGQAWHGPRAHLYARQQPTHLAGICLNAHAAKTRRSLSGARRRQPCQRGSRNRNQRPQHALGHSAAFLFARGRSH